MTTVLLVIHLLLAITLVCIVLIQRSEGGALGMGGGGMGGFMTSRSTANLLTRTTAVLAAPVGQPAPPSHPTVPLAKWGGKRAWTRRECLSAERGRKRRLFPL